MSEPVKIADTILQLRRADLATVGALFALGHRELAIEAETVFNQRDEAHRHLNTIADTAATQIGPDGLFVMDGDGQDFAAAVAARNAADGRAQDLMARVSVVAMRIATPEALEILSDWTSGN